MAKETFTHTAPTGVDRQLVWRSLDDPETWAAIGGIDRVYDPIIDQDGHLRGFSFDTRVGGTHYRGWATPRERIEGKTMSWNVDSSEIRGVTGVDLTETEDGTVVKVTVEVQSKGMLSSLFFPIIAGAVRHGLPGAVDDFVRTLGDPG